MYIMKTLKYIHISNYITESGKACSVNLSYQLFGKSLHTAPIVLVNHALTGNSNVSGKDGWWNSLIGPKKTIETNKYTILAFNIPGNGYDEHQENLIDNYKDFTAQDIAKLFNIGLQKLNITSLYAVIGGSVGGGIAWELAVLRPNLIKNLIPIASDWKSTDWVIANCFVQDSILNNSSKPLYDARLHAMTLYRTPESLSYKFKKEKDNDLFNVESWLNHHGNALENRFKVSAYKMMNQILKTIDITKSEYDYVDVISKIQSNIHIITIKSDLLFKPEENWETYVELKLKKDNIAIGEINSIHGHDAFLIEYQQLSNLLKPIFQPKKEKIFLKKAV